MQDIASGQARPRGQATRQLFPGVAFARTGAERGVDGIGVAGDKCLAQILGEPSIAFSSRGARYPSYPT